MADVDRLPGAPLGTYLSVISENLVKWAAWMRAAGRPETTIELRTYHVGRVFREVKKSPWDVSTEDLIFWLASHNWAPNTRRSYRASLRGFYAWAQATGERADSPAHLLPQVDVPRGVPRPTPELIYREALREAGERERLMIRLAAQCGLRRGEIARVSPLDVAEDLLGYHLRVTGKGGHVREVPLPLDLALEIQAVEGRWLFPSSKRPGAHLTPRYVGDLVGDLLPGAWACHSLRHRCGTTAYQATHDLRAVQELLGHAKPETTALYTKVPTEAIRAAVAAAAA